MAVIPLVAHAKWFVRDPEGFVADWGFFTQPATLGLLLVAVGIALGWRWVAERLPSPELAILSPLGGLAPWVPRLLGVHLGVSLVALAATNAYLAPNLSLARLPGGWVVALAEGVVGVWLISGIAVRPAALAVVGLGPLALVLAGPIPVLEALDLLGVALFLAMAPPGRNDYGATMVDADTLRAALLALRLGVGGALIVVAVTEKLVYPALTLQFLDAYPAFDLFRLVGLDLGPGAFVQFAAAVEVLFGLLIISGAAPQAVVLVAGIPFNATLFFLNRNELFGHLPIYGAMLALLVYGSTPDAAGVIASVRASTLLAAGRIPRWRAAPQ